MSDDKEDMDLDTSDQAVPMSKPNVVFSREDNDANDFLACWEIFGVRPSKVVVFSKFEETIWDTLHEKYEVDDKETQKITEILPDEEGFTTTIKFFVKITDNMYLSFIEFDERDISNLVIFYNQSEVESSVLNDFLNDLQTSIILDGGESEIGLFNSLTYNYPNASYDLVPYKINELDESFDMFYSDETFKKAKKSVRDINKNSKGLTIYHGDKGRGKTTFMHYLMRNSKKGVIHIPSSMIEQVLNNVDFLHFLEQHKGSTLIFDDSEVFFTRGHHKNLLVSNLLQMIDGVLSNNLSINIVLSVNLDKDKIDSDLFGCNHLLNDVFFSKLSSESATELSKYLKNKRKYKKESNLIEVINDRVGMSDKPFAL